jgi:structural maintenance of chromosome 4
VLARREEQRAVYESLRVKRYDEFMNGFSMIKSKLKQLYRMITLGGDADLEFADSMDPFSEGIIFSVRPPKKGWKNISNLSGGEKVCTAVAVAVAVAVWDWSQQFGVDCIGYKLTTYGLCVTCRH